MAAMSYHLGRVGSGEGILNGHISLYVTVVKYGKYHEVVTLTNCELPVWNGRQWVGSGIDRSAEILFGNCILYYRLCAIKVEGFETGNLHHVYS